MQHTTDTTNPLQPIAQAIAEEIIRQLGAAAPQPPAPPTADVGDMLYPVTLICLELGKRGRPIAYQTFQKNYLDRGLLRLADHPTDRKARYVRLADWLKLKKEIR